MVRHRVKFRVRIRVKDRDLVLGYRMVKLTN